MIGVLIADDHEIVRRGLRMTIAGEEDMRLLGEARTGREAVALAAALRPDVVLLDVQMPDMDGVAAAAAIRAAQPEVAVLMLTSFGGDAQLYAALRAGASGYLLKDTSGDDLVRAIRGAARGDPQLHPDIARRLMRQAAAPADPLAALTPREREVLAEMATGKSNSAIADELVLTKRAVEKHVGSVFHKLDLVDEELVSRRVTAVLLYLREARRP
jgi:DNA-binding NarL/FixJ family response regulator